MASRKFTVVVAGATGLVGRTMIRVLEERRFPLRRLVPLASHRSVGTTVPFRAEQFPVMELTEQALIDAHADVALFSAGAAVSKEFAPIAARRGIVVIDNSSAFRMDEDVPLVVPEVNPHAIFSHQGIIANPNCSTIQMVVVLKPLHDAYRIRRVVVATYQSVTGAGRRGHDQLLGELAGNPAVARKFPHRIAMNCIPHIDSFESDGYTKEEHKMMNETRKIMGDNTIQVSATCVRVPTVGGHSESVNIEFERPYELADARRLLERMPGVLVVDDLPNNSYPMPVDSQDRDEVFVGRIRRDSSIPSGLNLWIVADNVRKGAATNAVQIAEELLGVHQLPA